LARRLVEPHRAFSLEQSVARLSRANIKGAQGNKPIHGCADFLGSPIAFLKATFSDLEISKGSIVEATRRAPASPSPRRARLARPPWGRPSWAARPLSEPSRHARGGSRGRGRGRWRAGRRGRRCGRRTLGRRGQRRRLNVMNEPTKAGVVRLSCRNYARYRDDKHGPSRTRLALLGYLSSRSLEHVVSSPRAKACSDWE
jgi:hypothetical protein